MRTQAVGWAGMRAIGVLILAAHLAACSLPGPAPVVSATYDLGPQPAYPKSNPALRGTLLIPPVRAPAWLDESDIVYRLLYEDRSRPQGYTTTRWAADPPSLLTDRLRSRFAAVADAVVTPAYGVNSDYTLRVELEDFSQGFEAPAQSRVRLRARASLVGSAERSLIAQRVFEFERPAAPDAVGAVKALSEATEAFLEELVTWAAEQGRARAKKAVKP